VVAVDLGAGGDEHGFLEAARVFENILGAPDVREQRVPRPLDD
jgi:hypothetical protein